MRRLERIYESSPHPNVHQSIIESMNRLVDRPGAIRFLRRIAVQPPDERAFPRASGYAIFILSTMGEEGPAVLRLIHRRNEIRDPQTKRYLEEFAARDYLSPARARDRQP